MKIQVIKRDGTKQDFDLEKILRVVKTAGLSDEKCKILGETIQNWILGINKKEISSLTIRDKVISELNALDPYVFNMFTWYQKTKEKHV